MKDERPTHLDLFSGIGGFALAAQWAGFRTIGFCEIDKYCQGVLRKNFGAIMANTDGSRRQGHELQQASVSESASKKVLTKNFLADAASRNNKHSSIWQTESHNGCPIIHTNIFDLDGRDFAGIDLITGGFPCQPFSVAGKRRGAADDRAIWPEMFRVIKEARPAWMLGENVPGIISMELDNVLSDLEGIGYATRSFVIPACAVDARHRRDRLWIIAKNISDSERDGPPQSEKRRSFIETTAEQSAWAQHALYAAGTNRLPSSEGNVSNARSGRFGECESEREQTRGIDGENKENGAIWLPEPSVGRVAHGIPSRVDRLKGLGNAIVPQVAYEILREIRKLI